MRVSSFVIILFAVFLVSMCGKEQHISETTNMSDSNKGLKKEISVSKRKSTEQTPSVIHENCKNEMNKIEKRKNMHDGDLQRCMNGFQANTDCENCYGYQIPKDDAEQILKLAVDALLKKHDAYFKKKKGKQLEDEDVSPHDLISDYIFKKKNGKHVIFANVISKAKLDKGIRAEATPLKLWFEKQQMIESGLIIGKHTLNLETWPLVDFDMSQLSLKDNKGPAALRFVLEYGAMRGNCQIIVLLLSWAGTTNYIKRNQEDSWTWSTNIALSGYPDEEFYFVKEKGFSWRLVRNFYYEINKPRSISKDECEKILKCFR